MKKKNLIITFLFLLFEILYAEENEVSLLSFSPLGEVKNVRQVVATFSDPIVPFGEPRLVEPFIIECPEKGEGRWVDGKNWVYDFKKNLPAGINCKFTLKSDIKSLSGKSVTSPTKEFYFSTGGPAIIRLYPYEGSEIDEEQIFIFTLDAQVNEDSVISNVSCFIKGINEKVEVKIIKGEDRNNILKTQGIDEGYYDEEDEYGENKVKLPKILIQCKRTFPNNTDIKIIWGKGVTSLSGVPTSKEQVLNFKTRGPFVAKFSCERENPQANCIPILPITVEFSSSVSWEYASKITLKGKDGTLYKISETNASEDEENVSEKFVNYVVFEGPFPENSTFTIDIPKDIKDDAGRPLSNIKSFPLEVKTDEPPPLVKFAAPFGIIELNGDKLLPVTVRNIEAQIKTKILNLETKKEGFFQEVKEGVIQQSVNIGEKIISILPDSIKEKGENYIKGLKGRLNKISINQEEEIIKWLKLIYKKNYDYNEEREISIFKDSTYIEDFLIPKPGGEKAFEVIGIPLKEAGFYVVEIESKILGMSLLGENKSFYVVSGALLTNLSAHFKWGKESSLVWVTTLDKGEPVKDASIIIRNYEKGEKLWEGKTDENGIALISNSLSIKDTDSLIIFAKTSSDMTFVLSTWTNGIETWRYNLPQPYYYPQNDMSSIIGHTILDRTLLRAGDTFHMKHIIRKHTIFGFSNLNSSEFPKNAIIIHRGSNQKYQFPLNWDLNGTSETTWEIPKEAKLGVYDILLIKEDGEKNLEENNQNPQYYENEYQYFSYPLGIFSGSFRVEEFRVPLMKGIIKPPEKPLINVDKFDIDILVTYLSGGGASKLPVKVRSMVNPKYVNFDEYEGFIFTNGDVNEKKLEWSEENKPNLKTVDLILDKEGSARCPISELPKYSFPVNILTELEFRDPNGEIQTISSNIPLWPSNILVGIKFDSWAVSKESFLFYIKTLDIMGNPVPEKKVTVEIFQKKYYSHRKRLIGGFYSFEHKMEIKKIGVICEGETDSKGNLICDVESPVSGNVILQAKSYDDNGNLSIVNREIWVAGKDEWWFDLSDSDRIDLIPEKRKYEPKEVAKFQVRMPFREATALITVEREGIIESYVRKLSGKMPVIEVPIKGEYAPNVFVSVLCVRGRVSDIEPTALIDLGKPAFKLGIAEINVGWKEHELKVNISSDKEIYKIREKAIVSIEVEKATGEKLSKGAEIAISVVDEGLLELMENESFDILKAMMGKRFYEVKTSTAQLQVVGKRHYGLKALPSGGGGGRQVTRELFDTLLFWKGKVPLDKDGKASLEIPLNDSLTSFRILVAANSDVGLFGKGEKSIRTTQDLILLSSLPPVIREGDKFKASFIVRNASNRRMNVEIKGKIKEYKELNLITQHLEEGEAKEIGWEIYVPLGFETLTYELEAIEKEGDAKDTLKVTQKVSEAIKVRTIQSTITQIEKDFRIEVEKPSDALQEKGGINLLVKPKLIDGLDGVILYMKNYPYRCMEQKISIAVSLRDKNLWKKIMNELPAYIDSEGLVKYFPNMAQGSDVLTSYILSIADEIGWEIPQDIKENMENGLKSFIEGKIIRYYSLPTADLSIRKLAALEALSRNNKGEEVLLSSISIEPNLWPTSALIDWISILLRMEDLTNQKEYFNEAENILRARLNFQGSIIGFSTASQDRLWWLMVSEDLNVVKGILIFLKLDKWKKEIPKIVKGALNRQKGGHWDTTIANAWGVTAMKKFSENFELTPVTGTTYIELETKKESFDWDKKSDKLVKFTWPKEKESINIVHNGTGKPWATIQSLAAIPLKEPFSTGYKIKKSLIKVEQKEEGKWKIGDVMRVKLELESQADMTWVVVNDPIPAGATILGSGLGRDSFILTNNEKQEGYLFPIYEERSFESFRVYYEYVPQGKWTIEYTLRFNNEGEFNLPETRVEALYAPEMFGEIPNEKLVIYQ